MSILCPFANPLAPSTNYELANLCLPTLVLIAQAVFVSESGHTDRQTDKQSHRRNWSPSPRFDYCRRGRLQKSFGMLYMGLSALFSNNHFRYRFSYRTPVRIRSELKCLDDSWCIATSPRRWTWWRNSVSGHVGSCSRERDTAGAVLRGDEWR